MIWLNNIYFPLAFPLPPKPFPSKPGRAFPLGLSPFFLSSRLSLRIDMLSDLFFCFAAMLAFKVCLRSSLDDRRQALNP